jgi:hypothetical protein
MRTVRTTLFPDEPIEVGEAEYTDLLRQGLLLPDVAATPALEAVPEPPAVPFYPAEPDNPQESPACQ